MMGLRLVAHYYDRVEALIVFSALDAAGVPVFVESHSLLTVDPGYLGALGGFRLVVCEEDLEAALSILQEARTPLSPDADILEIEFDLLNGVASFLVGVFASAPSPIRGRRWKTQNT